MFKIDEIEFLQAAYEVLENAQRKISGAHLQNVDEETTLFIEFWFDHPARRQLTALSQEIQNLPGRDLRDVLWCVFSRMIVTKQRGVSLAMDVFTADRTAFSKARPFCLLIFGLKRSP